MSLTQRLTHKHKNTLCTHNNTPTGRILEQLITLDGIRSLPTIDHLLSESFFKDVELGQVEKGSFKLSARVKEALGAARDASYKAMRTRQLQYYRCKKEEEKKKAQKKKEQQREREKSRHVKSSQQTGNTSTEVHATVGGFVVSDSTTSTSSSSTPKTTPNTTNTTETSPPPPPPPSQPAQPPPPQQQQ
eukprot:m.39940 g.39940  ORF g.39940 m.39940 type:complete len:189 (+) comp10310_c0_seq15:1262-1828(+)